MDTQANWDQLFQKLDGLHPISYIVNSASGAFQVFQTFTYGEMVISSLLFCILLVLIFRWIYEVIR